MALEDIESPPYPGEGTTAAGLFQTLGDLRKWVLYYRDDVNAEVGAEVIPAVKEIPDRKAYLSQPVGTQYEHLLIVRRLREEWDHLVRTFEDDWSCKPCVRTRAMLVQTAAILLNNAFTPYEVREAKQNAHLEKMQQSFERLMGFFRKVMEPGGHEPENKTS